MRRKISRTSKEAARLLAEAVGRNRMLQLRQDVFEAGKAAIDGVLYDLGRMLAESLLLMEREQLAGPDYQPISNEIFKGGRQQGSVYIGGSKTKVLRPRVHGPNGEIPLKTYAKMQDRRGFSEELLAKSLRGLAGRRYEETTLAVAANFGISPSSVSRHIVAATSEQLRAFRERRHQSFALFAMYLDTIHRGGRAFIVALGIDIQGQKRPLGFWEGATENHDICQELLNDLEARELAISSDVIFVTDGGSGVIKALREKFGKHLLHQRCTIHKLRNIVRHLPKKYRAKATESFTNAISCVRYQDAKDQLKAFEKWLRDINASAANSLLEAEAELLTLHRLQVSELLRKSLHTTNPIESMFSNVRECEMNIKRWRATAMAQRWLASVLLHVEKGFNRVRGYRDIDAVRQAIHQHHAELKAAA